MRDRSVGESLEQKFQLRSHQRCKRAAAEIDSQGRNRKMCALQVEIAQYGFAKSPSLRTIEQIFVKSAIWTDPCAERNVNVDVTNHIVFPSVIPSGARTLS